MNLTIENEIFEDNKIIFDSNISTLSNDSLQYFPNNKIENIEDKNSFLDINKEFNLKTNISISKDNWKNSFIFNKKRGRKKNKKYKYYS